jgi:hypothetical protein
VKKTRQDKRVQLGRGTTKFDLGQNADGMARAFFADHRRRPTMPADSLLVSIAVVAMFVAFGAALFWADRQTRSGQQNNTKRRAF